MYVQHWSTGRDEPNGDSLKAVDEFFEDTSRSRAETKETLEEIAEECDTLADTIRLSGLRDEPVRSGAW